MSPSPLDLRTEIASLIKTVCEQEGIHDHTILDVQTNQKGEGYLGEIFMITVKDKYSNRQLDLIIKAAFTEEKVRDMVPIRMSFQNEIFFYQHVNPLYKKLEKEHDVAGTVQLVPRCYKVSVEENEEMLALENLKSVGFEVFDKKATLDHDHVELILKTYGRLHAYSFALRDQHFEEYSKMVKKFYNVYDEFMKQSFFGDYLVEMSKLAESSLVPGEDDKVIKDFQKYMGRNVVNIFANIVVEKCDHPAILHGDCWSNNMLFRYEETNNRKKPVDIRLIDWQLMKVGSPVCDLSYCLYSGASQKVFDNLNDYLKIYHDSFSSFLRELGSDPDELFPFSTLLDHWKRYSRFGMIMSLGILRMKLTHNEDIVDLRDGLEMEELVSAVSATKFNSEDYHKRIRGLLWHMSEIGAL